MPPSPEIWLLVFEQLAGDYEALRNVSLVSRAWRTLSQPCLLQVVDLSSHNIEGRLTEHEHGGIHPIVHSSHHGRYRPKSLLPRQRRFLALIAAQPALAKYVKSFTWTLAWGESWNVNEDSYEVQDIDRKTWDVFTRLHNVSHLDLAYIHDVWDEEFVWQSPRHLFPRVTDLRLLGWMHRDLVKAIISSIDTTRLRRLSLDYLEDQPTLPGGHPMNSEVVMDFLPHVTRSEKFSVNGKIIDDDLFHRQETGKAAIFPGPMWLPMRLLLAKQSLDSLSHLQISIPPSDSHVDMRSYHTVFQTTANLIRKASSSLISLTINLGEKHSHYIKYESSCGTGRHRAKEIYLSTYLPWAIQKAATFLKQLLVALSDSTFPNLEHLMFEGFHLLEHEAAGPDLAGVLPYIESCRFKGIDFTGISHVDGRLAFCGTDICEAPDFDEDVVRNS